MLGSTKGAQPSASASAESREQVSVPDEAKVRSFYSEAKDAARLRFSDSNAGLLALARMIMRELGQTADESAEGGIMSHRPKPSGGPQLGEYKAEVPPQRVPSVPWTRVAITCGLLALSATAGWAGLVFMASLLCVGLISHRIWHIYLCQSRRSEGVSPAVRFFETTRRYIANEDPPQATVGRAD